MNICHSYGMEFLSLDSGQEAEKFLQLCASNINLFDEWTNIGGLTKVAKSTTEWFWVATGEKLNFNLNFMPGEPNDGGGTGVNEMCLSFKFSDAGKALFNDIKCYQYGIHSYKFVCQTKVYEHKCQMF